MGITLTETSLRENEGIVAVPFHCLTTAKNHVRQSGQQINLTVPNSELCAIRQLCSSFVQSLMLDTDNKVDLAASSAGLTRFGRRRLRPYIAQTARGRLDT